MLRNRKLVIAAASIAGCAILFANLMFDAHYHDDPNSYQSTPLYPHPLFTEEHKSAIAQNAEWVKDPSNVAYKYITSGYDECKFNTVSTKTQGSGQAVVVIEQRCFDDSIAATMYRVELIQKGSAWTVVGKGWIHSCSRIGLLHLLNGYGGWHTKRCP